MDSPYFVAARPYKIHYDPRFTLRKVPLLAVSWKGVVLAAVRATTHGSTTTCVLQTGIIYDITRPDLPIY